MQIYEIEKDCASIFRKIIIILQVITIIVLLVIGRVRAIPVEEEKYFLMTATAYYPGAECTAPYDDGFTAIGHVAGKGSIAIDPVNGPLKFNQKVYVEGYGYGICNDVGGAIKNWKIDLCYDTLEEAKEWGRKLVKVFVID